MWWRHLDQRCSRWFWRSKTIDFGGDHWPIWVGTLTQLPNLQWRQQVVGGLPETRWSRPCTWTRRLPRCPRMMCPSVSPLDEVRWSWWTAVQNMNCKRTGSSARRSIKLCQLLTLLTLWHLTCLPSAATTTSVNCSCPSSLLNTLNRLLWWLFHLRQYCCPAVPTPPDPPIVSTI